MNIVVSVSSEFTRYPKKETIQVTRGKVSRCDFPLPASLLWQNRILLLRLQKHQHKCKCLAWTLLNRRHYVYSVCCRVPGSCQQGPNHPVYPAIVDQLSQNCTSTFAGLHCSIRFPHGWLLNLVHQQMS